ncbi:hypothetical protein B0H13DRAFT_1561575, partial [Mycena leptocephala]
EPFLVVKDVPEHLTRSKLRAKDKILCLVCGKQQKLNGTLPQRHHVAMHILLSLRSVQEEGLDNPIGSEPCGYCGLDGCFSQLLDPKHPKKPVSIKSSCRYHYAGMNYKAAKIPAKCSPSTNVPIYCALCPPNPISGEPQTIWKYNAMHHIVVEH